MAEGVDNDMSQQQREEDGVPHGKEVSSQHLDGSAASVQRPIASVAQPSGNGSVSGTVSTAIKKKSSFQITSITETKPHNRGDSNGYDGELEELNESDVTEVEVEVEEKAIGEPPTGNGNGASRFKVVKISRTESYKRGRWMCLDYPDSAETTLTNVPGSKENPERPDVQSNAKHVSFSNPTGNYTATGDVEGQGDFRVLPQCLNGGFSGSTHTGSEGAVGFSKKKDPDVQAFEISEFSSSTSTMNTLESVEKLSDKSGDLPAVAAPSGTLDSELPIVNVIASAMNQITQIKSDLLTVVNKEVQTLKKTITKLQEENEVLKHENQRLRETANAKST